MLETTKQAFGVAGETVKQLITLSTSVLALTVTFKANILPVQGSHSFHWILIIALICHLVSICSGILALYGIVNEMEDADEERLGEPTVRAIKITKPAKYQILSFVLGLSILVTYLGEMS
jgi:hypothetical protein